MKFWRKTFNSKAGRILIPLLPALVILAAVHAYSAQVQSSAPDVRNGILDLSGRGPDQLGAFNLIGQWEFYWDRVLDAQEIHSGQEQFILVEAPGQWTDLTMDGRELPAFGKATYRVHVVDAPVGERLAVRIQNQASAYRFYIDDRLLAANGNFGDTADALISGYRPQFAEFTCQAGDFDLIMQVSNHAYAVGGMWEPIRFGTVESMSRADDTIKIVEYLTIGSLLIMGFVLALMFIIVRKEKEMLILCGIGLCVLLNLSENGDAFISYLWPGMPIAGFGWIDYLSQGWIQFFLFYFLYAVYPSLVKRWLVHILLIYSICMTAFVLLAPFEVAASTYQIMYVILLLVLLLNVFYAAQAALSGFTGGRSLLAAMALILFTMLYDALSADLSLAVYFMNSWALCFTVLFLVQFTIVARHYREAQRIEMGLLKSQIRPHFVHNALATIISISRRDSERSRELLMDFSSYLRGCYDYEGEDLILLEEELDFVRAYAALEQARFGEKLKVVYQIEVNNILVPPLILQPLVENAFIHGLREKEEGGIVTVYVLRRNGGIVRLGVCDDGMGLQPQRSVNDERQGIGTANINRRLARLYHTRLVYIVPEGGGCEVYMDIPIMEVSSDEGYAY
ncbi:MAG: histidine kinase [Syntrophomonadaceae bacterium]